MHTTTRTLLSALLCALAIPVASLAVGSQDIFKCVDGEATAYQSMPCASGQAETRMTTGAPSSRAEVEVGALPTPPAHQPLRTEAGPWRRKALTLGMSDDEVLNLPGWGRPNRITRTRTSRTWREEWTYGPSTTGERRLLFANARLVDVVDRPSADQVAQLTLQ